MLCRSRRQWAMSPRRQYIADMMIFSSHRGRSGIAAHFREVPIWGHDAPGGAPAPPPFGSAAAAFEHLKREGILVRPRGAYGLRGHLRITRGTRSNMRRVVVSLAKFSRSKFVMAATSSKPQQYQPHWLAKSISGVYSLFLISFTTAWQQMALFVSRS
jgi:hypothetical protein